MTVNMKVDLVGKYRRGLALGLNEFAGYVSVALIGFVTGYLAASYGLRPYPFYLGISFVLLGFFISLLMVKDTRKFTDLEIKTHFQDNVSREKEVEEEKQKLQKKSNTRLDKEVDLDSSIKNKNHVNKIKKTLDFKQAFIETSWNNRSLLAASQAGLINNLIFGMSWGLFTLYFVSLGISLTDTALLKTLHPAIWGFLQLATGPISDNIGRKKLIYSGMIIQASGLWTILAFKNEFTGLFAGMSLLGIGTAFVYPTLLAAISDIANPQWRATSLGVYRFWRDLGFVFGAVGVGFISDVFNASIAIQAVAWISLASGIVVLLLMKETKKIELL
jgi:MFS family permease